MRATEKMESPEDRGEGEEGGEGERGKHTYWKVWLRPAFLRGRAAEEITD